MKQETFREKMLAAMAAGKWSVARLAREAGVTYDVVRELKRRPNSSTKIDTARKIGGVLGFSVDTLEDDQVTAEEVEFHENLRALRSPESRKKLLDESRFLLRLERAKEEEAGDENSHPT